MNKPAWWHNGIIYQIYPRSFNDSNNDGIGDLPGITAKMDYLAELGVDAIWLSPINPSPDVDFGYDVSNYLDIDPKFGTLADFDKLVAEAHKRNIKIILDLVLNHSSDQHEWFKSARQSKDSPYHDYFLWRDPHKTNNWTSVFGGKGWEYVPEVDQYYFHMFYKEQPDLNWHNPKVREAMLDVFRFWLKRGADGFRLDVFNCYYKDAEYRSNPGQLGIRPFEQQQHIYDVNQPEMVPLVEDIRKIVDTNPDGYVIGETFISTADKAAFYSAPGRLHAAFNFDLLQCPWKPDKFLKKIQSWEQALDNGGWPNWVLNNHDNPRSATRFGKGENDMRLKAAAAILMTLRGTVFMYYGEEIGMRDVPISRSEVMDPIGKRYWPIFKGRDGCRAPMQWDAGANAGFSQAEPWLKLNQDFPFRNVSAQRSEPNSLFYFYRKLIQLRKELPALQSGMFLPLTYDPKRILAYLRKTDKQSVIVAVNFSSRPTRFFLGRETAKSNWQPVLSNYADRMPEIRHGELMLLKDEVCLLVSNDVEK